MDTKTDLKSFRTDITERLLCAVIAECGRSLSNDFLQASVKCKKAVHCCHHPQDVRSEKAGHRVSYGKNSCCALCSTVHRSSVHEMPEDAIFDDKQELYLQSLYVSCIAQLCTFLFRKRTYFMACFYVYCCIQSSKIKIWVILYENVQQFFLMSLHLFTQNRQCCFGAVDHIMSGNYYYFFLSCSTLVSETYAFRKSKKKKNLMCSANVTSYRINVTSHWNVIEVHSSCIIASSIVILALQSPASNLDL